MKRTDTKTNAGPGKEKRAANRLLAKKTHDLAERVKELNCLYAFSTLLEKPGITLPEIYQGLVDLIPPAFQHPEVTCARLVVGGDSYVCVGFRETPWKLSAPFRVYGSLIGTLEVFYLEERPPGEIGPFLLDERRLITDLAERLGRTIERFRGEAALSRACADLNRLLDIRTRELRLTSEQLQQEIRQADALEVDLLLERSKFKIILDHMNTGVAIIGTDDAIQYINPVLEREFGQVRDRPCHAYFRCDASSCSWGPGNGVGRPDRWEWTAPDTGRIYEVFAVPIPNVEGTVSRLEIFHDISDRKLSEKALRESEARLREISARLMTIQEDERRRFAREIHDGLGQMLSSIKFTMESGATPSPDGPLPPGLSTAVLSMVREAIEEVRRLQMDLRPPMLDDLGIIATLTWFSREFFGAYAPIRCENRFNVREEDVPGPLKTPIFRIAQEAMNNAAKHSGADSCVLSLTREDGGLALEIADDGAGFDTGTFKKGFGLIGMKERAALSGGTLTVVSAPGKGTRIRALWPA